MPYHCVMVKLTDDEFAQFEHVRAALKEPQAAPTFKRLLREWTPIPIELLKVYLYWKNIKKDRFAGGGQEYLDMVAMEEYFRSRGIDIPETFITP